MDDDRWIDRVRREGDAFAATLEGDQGAAVAACPGWDLAALTGHLGFIQRNVTEVLITPADVEFRWRPAESPGAGPELASWFREGLDELVAALRSSDPDEVGPSFIGPQPKRFWRRRQAQETAVHRWDAQAALGDPSPLDPDLAVDGIDERFDVFLPRRRPERFGGDGATLHLHATDAPGEWLLRFDPDLVRVERRHEKGDVAVRATASDLLLLLWGRVGGDRLDVFGDATVLDRWHRGMSDG